MEKRPHTRSEQVRCTCGRLAGELPGKCREWSGDGRAEGGRLGLMYVPPALSGGLASPTQTLPIPHIPRMFPNRFRPFCEAPEAEFVLGCRLPPPPRLPLQSVAILGSGRRVCSRLRPFAQLAGAPHRPLAHVSPPVQIFRARSQTRLQELEDQLSGPRSASRPECCLIAFVLRLAGWISPPRTFSFNSGVGTTKACEPPSVL